MQRIEARPVEQYATAGAAYDDYDTAPPLPQPVYATQIDQDRSQPGTGKETRKQGLKPAFTSLPAGLVNTGRDAHVQTFDEIYGQPEDLLEIEVGKATTMEPKVGTPYTAFPIRMITNIPAFKLRQSEVWRRYSEFEVLHDVLERESSRVHIPALPGKQWWKQRDEKFYDERQAGLQDFVRVVGKHPLLQTGSRILGAFLQDPHWNSRDWS